MTILKSFGFFPFSNVQEIKTHKKVLTCLGNRAHEREGNVQNLCFKFGRTLVLIHVFDPAMYQGAEIKSSAKWGVRPWSFCSVFVWEFWAGEQKSRFFFILEIF